jgi:very-short-patch-repair endonuclease
MPSSATAAPPLCGRSGTSGPDGPRYPSSCFRRVVAVASSSTVDPRLRLPTSRRETASSLTAPVRTLVDIAARLPRKRLEAAINEADKLGLTNPEKLRAAIDELRGQRGAGKLRSVLDRRTFVLTDSELERRFLPIARKAGLPVPQTQRMVNGFRVDFYWPELGLIVETDGLRYHRTPAQQAADRVRDQTHVAAGLTPLRFTHAQVRYEPGHVVETLRAITERLRGPSLAE